MPKKAAMAQVLVRTGQQKSTRKFFSTLHEVTELPHLIEAQLNSYKWFLEKGLKELLAEITPIKDFTGKNLEMYFGDCFLDKPKYDEKTARERNTTFEAPLYCSVKLVNKVTGKTKTQDVYLGDFPLMTPRATFVINGVERVVVSQLIKSPGVFFTAENSRGKNYYGSKVIPNRGAWLELDTDANNVIGVKIDRKRRIPITALLRVFGVSTNEEILATFADVDTDPDNKYITSTLEKDASTNADEGFKEVYKRIRPGDLATVDNAKSLISAMFFNYDRYDLSEVGRYKLNQRLNMPETESRILSKEDLVATIKEIIRLNNTQGLADDIDHLANRRIRSVGELIQTRFRVGLARMARIGKDRMSLADLDTVTPAQLIHVRPIVAAMQEFFSSSQLSQFMDQTNPLAELEHKRRLSAMGPGGLSRERAGFEVRDVHRSHYGRLCPITTPEGPNIGLVAHLATYARINDFGFIETPYRKVKKTAKNDGKDAVGEIAVSDIEGVIKEDDVITESQAKQLQKHEDILEIRIKARATDKIEHLDAYEEEKLIIGQANIVIDEKGHFSERRTSVRVHGEPSIADTNDIDYLEVSPKQIISVTTSLIPFLEHDDANRALMGSNMQRQAVSCIKPSAPIVGTGMERKAAYDSGQVILSDVDGEVVSVAGNKITVEDSESGKKKIYDLLKFIRTNSGTAINQIVRVNKGDKVKKGDLLADGASTEMGELALGQNVLVAFMSWQGYNYEDAIILSERVVKRDLYSSVHIEDFKVDVRDTKLGPEIITRDIPNVGEEKLKDLNESGVIRIGAQVKAGDILVGKITPKGETDLTAEEKLLRVIFGEKSRDVKDTSLVLPHGEYGKVVNIREFSRENGDKLPSGVIRSIQVSVAVLRKIQVGDKMAGRHGNKGVVSKVVPIEDMPHLKDGTPVDIILNPLGVASRMNLGQILETHLGLAAKKLGYIVATPVLDGITEDQIKGELVKAGYPTDGKVEVFDGRTGEKFDERVTVGYTYMLKLHHLVDDKMHARSTGPYSLITQQPLGGKAQFGGQRFGEMEVWALEGYGAAHTLQEMITIKSDDVVGRSKTYEAIVKGEPIKKPNIPESFRVLVKELQSLCLDVDLLGAQGVIEDDSEIKESIEASVMQEKAPEPEPALDFAADGEKVAEKDGKKKSKK
ncbi:MAG: DNA-directed RNA polymerase subunit beta [Candidatus Doudnabacteria bacterium Gr01-1014_77]|uniref:DNA-directed RNA polymerase subunit beta n=1 Tax=Candidatus Doudnabacteria bacterium Gr01-1014_77 TaxID=2017133 RepID=A0A554JCM3_9BACT|nr:MAG: DNA-directed RNA polymerase subunit beta [Candidatus Doudnabacteria bacterium Gr01-1014_77]